MIIDCIGCLHGHYPKLEGGDLLIVTGDLTARDTFQQHIDFKLWLYEQNYRKKIVIAGNHDNIFYGIKADQYIFSSYNTETGEQLSYADYLCDSGTEFEGLRIWGAPWTKTFPGMNPKCKAFTCDTEEELAEKFSLIPDDIDILITHGPPYGILDNVKRFDYPETKTRLGNFLNDQCEHVGSKTLFPDWDGGLKLHVFSHIHEAYGEDKGNTGIFAYHYVNCSHVNERYQPVNKPIRVIL